MFLIILVAVILLVFVASNVYANHEMYGSYAKMYKTLNADDWEWYNDKWMIYKADAIDPIPMSTFDGTDLKVAEGCYLWSGWPFIQKLGNSLKTKQEILVKSIT